jgi:hypothetical protein
MVCACNHHVISYITNIPVDLGLGFIAVQVTMIVLVIRIVYIIVLLLEFGHYLLQFHLLSFGKKACLCFSIKSTTCIPMVTSVVWLEILFLYSLKVFCCLYRAYFIHYWLI